MSNSPQDPTRLEQFVAMSSVLTGFTPDVISPPFDPTDPPLKQLYLDTANRHDQATLNALLTTFERVRTLPAQQIADTLLEVNSTKPSPTAWMARSIVKMWYLGSWYPADATATAFNGGVISMNAYTGGLAWTAAQAHPMGYSELKFGYWNAPPAPLAGVLDGTKEKSNG